MNKFLTVAKSYVNGDTISTFGNNLIGLIRGPIVMVLVSMYLTEEIQGYWYTFASLAALSIFADLGFGTIVGQFSAHEFSHLRFNEKKLFEGDDESLDKMSSLFKFILKWTACVVCVGFPVIMIAGFFVLNTGETDVNWIVPWILYVTNSGFSFFYSICSTFFVGCTQIRKVQTIGICSSICSSAATITLLIVKSDLYALAIPSIIFTFVNIVLLFVTFGKPMLQLLRRKQAVKITWMKSFLQLIWKYALSWASGYFIFQIYTPMAFLVYDPIYAGKVGITMTLCQACYTLASTWSYVVTPKINMAVSERDWKRGEKLTVMGILGSGATFLIGATIILLALGLLSDKIVIFQRFLGAGAASFLLAAWFLQIPINSIATYGRAHKQEPFVVESIVLAFFILGSTYLIITFLPITYLFAGFALANVVQTGVFVLKYFKRRDKWHAQLIDLQDSTEKAIQEQMKGLQTAAVAVGAEAGISISPDTAEAEKSCGDIETKQGEDNEI